MSFIFVTRVTADILLNSSRACVDVTKIGNILVQYLGLVVHAISEKPSILFCSLWDW